MNAANPRAAAAERSPLCGSVGRLERRDCSAYGREEPIVPDPGGQTRGIEDLALPSLQARDAEHDVALLELVTQSEQHVDRGGVQEGPRLRVQQQAPEIVGAVDEREDALSKVLGVDEERWRVEPIHEQPRDRLGAVPARDV